MSLLQMESVPFNSRIKLTNVAKPYVQYQVILALPAGEWSGNVIRQASRSALLQPLCVVKLPNSNFEVMLCKCHSPASA